jgi:MFS family permease
MSTGILSDLFSEDKRGLVMSIFNWGIYGGYGIAFPVGRYVPQMNTWDLVSVETQAPSQAMFQS